MPFSSRRNWEIRKLIGVPDTQNVLPIQHSVNKRLSDVGIRHILRTRWILEKFVELGWWCEQTLRLYAPGLAEYPELLAVLERVRHQVESEQGRWVKFEENAASEKKALYERNRLNIEMRLPLERGESFDDLVPPEALSNLLALAAVALGLTAAVTRILGDWDDVPPESEMELSGGFWIWPSGSHSSR